MSVDENTLWPQAWELTITIKNLLPTSFTTYADYLVQKLTYTGSSQMSNPSLHTNYEETTTSQPQEIL